MVSLPLVLASASPRRRELLGRLGLDLILHPAQVDETQYPGESPALHVLRVARDKSLAVTSKYPDFPVLAADTIVVLGDTILGKPSSTEAGEAMLQRLAGKTHRVLTAVALAFRGEETTHLAVAAVTFVPYDRNLYSWYSATGEGLDKAGAYAVQGQGAVLVERVEGNVQAVVGLPLSALAELFGKVGLRMIADSSALSLTIG